MTTISATEAIEDVRFLDDAEAVLENKTNPLTGDWVLPPKRFSGSDSTSESFDEKNKRSDSKSVMAEGYSKPLIKLPPGTLPRERVKVLQQWECVVTQVCEDSFLAELADLTEPGNPLELAEFSFEEVSLDDRKLLEVEAVFYWCIGYTTSKSGQVQRISEIRFKRSPKWTRALLNSIDKRSAEMYEQFSGDS